MEIRKQKRELFSKSSLQWLFHEREAVSDDKSIKSEENGNNAENTQNKQSNVESELNETDNAEEENTDVPLNVTTSGAILI